MAHTSTNSVVQSLNKLIKPTSTMKTDFESFDFQLLKSGRIAQTLADSVVVSLNGLNETEFDFSNRDHLSPQYSQTCRGFVLGSSREGGPDVENFHF